MAYLNEKLEQLEKSIQRWKEALEAEFSSLNRDASIQRFEFSFELLWKSVKLYLEEREKIDCYSPRSCFREIKNILGLTDEEIESCLKMAGDRNLASHVYSEEMANELYGKLGDYLKLTEKIYKKIQSKIN